jgi:hypothetical protein
VSTFHSAQRPHGLNTGIRRLAWGIGIFSVYTYIAEILVGLGAAEETPNSIDL